MNAWTDPAVERVVLMASSQIGKTESFILNPLGYFIHQDPAPILVVLPTLVIAQAFSKDRFTPMIEDSQSLRTLVRGEDKTAKAKDSSDTILHKEFPGGYITMAGANSPASLASRPIRILLFDEVDQYKESAGSQGDPIALGEKRTTAFWNKKIGMTSTPTVKGASRIEAAFDQSDQRRFYVPCPHCLEYQTFKFKNLDWKKEINSRGETVKHFPETTNYICEHCGAVISEEEKYKMILAGEWRAGAEFNGTAGFHINEIYSPFVTWSKLIENWIQAKKLPETLKVFINTSLAETWEEKGETIEETDLVARREHYEAEAPAGVLVITASVDVQGDRLEVGFQGWGKDQETWGIDYQILYGDPAAAEVWQDLEDQIDRTFEHESGIELRVACVTIDSGGHHTDQVYQFTKKLQRRARKIYATKGSSQPGKPLLSKMSKNNKLSVRMFIIGTETAKELIFGRLSIPDPGPGYCHFPRLASFDDEYFKQLTAEHCVTRWAKGVPRRSWILKTGQKRNEALDIMVGNFAALQILNPNFKKLAERIEDQSQPDPDPPEKPDPEGSGKKQPPGARRPGGRIRKKSWAKSWK